MLVNADLKDNMSPEVKKNMELAFGVGSQDRFMLHETPYQGIFVSGNFNLNHYLTDEWEDFCDFNFYKNLEEMNAAFRNDEPFLCTYGVCDSPEQFLQTPLGKFIQEDSREYCVLMVGLLKSEMDPVGGWRWHKWGPYIGLQEPTTEYLYDEPVIEEVYVFQICRKKQ